MTTIKHSYIIAVTLLIFFLIPQTTQAATVEVTNLAQAGWMHGREAPSITGDGDFVVGPQGVGSFMMATPDAGARYALAYSGVYDGLPFASISNISYRTYQETAGAQVIALQIHVDYDVTDADNSWQGRLVFEPIYTPGYTIQTGVWQTWDAMNGRWWATGGAGAGVCTPGGGACTWAQILATFPNAGIRAGDGTILFKVGSGWVPGTTGYVDYLSFNGTLFDFNPASIATGSQTPTIPACNFNDGRLNELYGGDCAAPVVPYCNGTNITVYRMNTELSTGYLVIAMTAEEIEAVGIPTGENVILAQFRDVILSRLTTGEFQVNAHYHDGKPYVMTWDNCPASTATRLDG
ncbi:MAG: hypothetical protein RLP44_01955 [Aggregatilineales bacterium]